MNASLKSLLLSLTLFFLATPVYGQYVSVKVSSWDRESTSSFEEPRFKAMVSVYCQDTRIGFFKATTVIKSSLFGGNNGVLYAPDISPSSTESEMIEKIQNIFKTKCEEVYDPNYVTIAERKRLSLAAKDKRRKAIIDAYQTGEGNVDTAFYRRRIPKSSLDLEEIIGKNIYAYSRFSSGSVFVSSPICITLRKNGLCIFTTYNEGKIFKSIEIPYFIKNNRLLLLSNNEPSFNSESERMEIFAEEWSFVNEHHSYRIYSTNPEKFRFSGENIRFGYIYKDNLNITNLDIKGKWFVQTESFVDKVNCKIYLDMGDDFSGTLKAYECKGEIISKIGAVKATVFGNSMVKWEVNFEDSKCSSDDFEFLTYFSSDRDFTGVSYNSNYGTAKKLPECLKNIGKSGLEGYRILE